MMEHRLRRFALASSILAILVTLAWADAARRAHVDGDALDAFVARTGSSELALSTSSRWLRHPAAAEPGAACQDQPPCLDVDPAGLAVGPPRAWFTASRALSLRLERREATP